MRDYAAALRQGAFLTSISAMLTGCGGSAAGESLQPPPQIAVAIHESAASVEMGQSDTLIATLTNDANNRGVRWYVSCPSAPCGAMAKAQSASGASDTYNAPSVVLAAETVTVTAISVSDPTKFATVELAVKPSPSPVITSGNPPNGTIGVGYGGRGLCGIGFDYGFVLDAAGGVPPYVWSWAAAPDSSLPPGLTMQTLCSLNKTFGITGVPTTAGTYNVIVTVTDSQSPPRQTSSNYTIVIAAH